MIKGRCGLLRYEIVFVKGLQMFDSRHIHVHMYILCLCGLHLYGGDFHIPVARASEVGPSNQYSIMKDGYYEEWHAFAFWKEQELVVFVAVMYNTL